MVAAQRQRARGAKSALLLLFAILAGCSTPSGSFTLFPASDHLMKTTKFVRRGVPKQLPVPRELEKTVIPEYILQPGDVLVVEPTKLDSPIRFPADQTILADGTVDLGRYGRPIVVGKTIEQVEAEVTAAVRSQESEPVDPINVRLVNPQSAVFYVLGEVNSPGSFPFAGRETVLDAILVAGGLTDKASQCNIILSRPTLPAGCRIVLPVCYRQIVQLGDTTTNYQIMPGDRVFVATRSFGEGCFSTKSCLLGKGLQCPCPPSSALLPAQPTITPPMVLRDGSSLPTAPEPLPVLPTAPDDMPTAPDVDEGPATVPEAGRRSAVIR